MDDEDPVLRLETDANVLAAIKHIRASGTRDANMLALCDLAERHITTPDIREKIARIDHRFASRVPKPVDDPDDAMAAMDRIVRKTRQLVWWVALNLVLTFVLFVLVILKLKGA